MYYSTAIGQNGECSQNQSSYGERFKSEEIIKFKILFSIFDLKLWGQFSLLRHIQLTFAIFANSTSNFVEVLWQGLTGLKTIIPLAQKATQNMEALDVYGEECGTCGTGVISRMKQGKCVQFGCAYGYYRASATAITQCDFECIERHDRYTPGYIEEEEEQNHSGLGTGAIVGIVIGSVAGVAVLGAIILFLVKPQLFKRKAVETNLDEVNSLVKNEA